MAAELSLWGFIKEAYRRNLFGRLADRHHRHAYSQLLLAKLQLMGAHVVSSVNSRASKLTQEASEGVGSNFLMPLKQIVDRGVPVLFVYGQEDDYWLEFERAKQGRLGDILRTHVVDVHVMPGAVHGFVDLGSQSKVIDLVTEWVSDFTVATPRS